MRWCYHLWGLEWVGVMGGMWVANFELGPFFKKVENDILMILKEL